MKILSLIIIACGIMACLLGAFFITNNEAFGKEFLLTGLGFTWLGLVLVIYFFVYKKRKEK